MGYGVIVFGENLVYTYKPRMNRIEGVRLLSRIRPLEPRARALAAMFRDGCRERADPNHVV